LDVDVGEIPARIGTEDPNARFGDIGIEQAFAQLDHCGIGGREFAVPGREYRLPDRGGNRLGR
jgi:hypothetical protein